QEDRPVIEIITVDTPSLGDRSYLATDGDVAVVIDPQRDVDRVLDRARERGVRITHVLETHVHNDYVTGGLALARATGAAYVVNADDEVAFERTPVRDGDVIETGAMRLRVLHTPGHTFTHLAYVLEEAGGGVVGVFTGGSLLNGSTGRPDLLGEEHAEALARHQWASAHRIADEVPGAAKVLPTHGFGSFCAATQAAGRASTVAGEKRSNPALTVDEDRYVRELLAGLVAHPAYYAHMGPRNAAGPDGPDLSPPAVADPAELRRRIDAGEWVVDLRDRTAFAAGHLGGSLNVGLEGSFATWLGWLVPWGTPVTLLASTAAEIAAAQRELVRIGIDRPAAMATGAPRDWTGGEVPASFPRATFADLAGQAGGPVVLDVRGPDERAAGRLEGSLGIPLHELADRLDEIPAGRPVWVHCAGGYRAAIAAAVLARAGFPVVAIDDSYANAGATGLPVAA
ncbi:MAG TPA: MBL fold metallo-hydrolase, partial [Acidimicrobiales bacterium]|nr:MBL fold metallo-hydrolase [Acidimicrobiales bacterium]